MVRVTCSGNLPGLTDSFFLAGLSLLLGMFEASAQSAKAAPDAETASAGPSWPRRFTVLDGRIYDPSGKEFIARGINIYASQIGEINNILRKFPGINMIRLASNPHKDSQQSIQGFLDLVTSKGIVVEVEDHSLPCCTTNTLSGQALKRESEWYAQIAAANKNNPYVWFGTANEPDNPRNPSRVVDKEVAIYNAIRQTDSDAIVMLELRGGGNADAMQQSPEAYRSMTNVIWDEHHYGLLDDGTYSTDPALIERELRSRIQAARSVVNAPVILGEYGISTNGISVDPNASLFIGIIQQSGYGNLPGRGMLGPTP
jgi:hypothetical protein